jgi:hypothetical protein
MKQVLQLLIQVKMKKNLNRLPEFYHFFTELLFKTHLIALNLINFKISVMSSGKVVLGVLAGLAAGAILGILFAPDSGVNTRKKIVRKSEEYIDDLKDKFNEFVDHVAEKVEKATEEVKEEKA